MFLRFVRQDSPEGDGVAIERDRLSCLRRITCESDTRRALPTELAASAYESWRKARADIFKAWQELTDPKNLQARVRPLFRRAAEHLRRVPPPGLSQAQADRVIDSIEAPWDRRIEKEIRGILQDPQADPASISLRLAAKVSELGLQPYQPPDPLPMIEEDEVQLVCWVAVSGAKKGT